VNKFKLLMFLTIAIASTKMFSMDNKKTDQNNIPLKYDNLIFSPYVPSWLDSCFCPCIVQARATVSAAQSTPHILMYINKNLQVQNQILQEISNKLDKDTPVNIKSIKIQERK